MAITTKDLLNIIKAKKPESLIKAFINQKVVIYCNRCQHFGTLVGVSQDHAILEDVKSIESYNSSYFNKKDVVDVIKGPFLINLNSIEFICEDDGSNQNEYAFSKTGSFRNWER